MSQTAEETSAISKEVFALHRYYIQANEMRHQYDRLVEQNGVAKVDEDGWTQQYIYLSLWYGALYTVIEGWQELRMRDAAVDGLLVSSDGDSYVGQLRRFRNGVFHYQSNYWDRRFTDFLGGGPGSAEWLRNTHEVLGRWFLELVQAHQSRSA